MCGIITQLRWRFAPEIFLIRDKGFDSIGPNLAKSTLGQGRRSTPLTPPADTAAGAAFAADGAPLANASTSALTILPLLPLPFTLPRSTLNSRASLRTPGPAYASPKARSSMAPPAVGAALVGAGAAGVALAAVG